VRRSPGGSPEDWPWSSAADWAGKEDVIVKIDRTLPPLMEDLE
jgi:hypothetical protein